MKRVLMFASVASMIDQFNMDNIRILQELGYKVDVACNFEYGNTITDETIENLKKTLTVQNIECFHISVPRGYKSIKDAFNAYKQLRELVEKNKYDLVHCHSPIGGVIARLACRKKRKYGLKLIYTAHGFHFFKGGPLKNWIFYPIEKLFAYYTDVLVTINQEDYNLAKKSFKVKKIEYIPGVGVDTKSFQSVVSDKDLIRKNIGVPQDAIMFFSVGELCRRKNHETAIRALGKATNKNLYYVICGKGQLEQYLKNLCKDLGVEDRVFLLGYRGDIPKFCNASDIYLFPSLREGLGLAAIEGMSAGLPLISANINGIKDYTEDGKTGYCIRPFDVDGFARAMDKLAADDDLRKKIGKHNQYVVKKFDIKNVSRIMCEIYKTTLLSG
jgi:glycosyltransferase involved in cell wall biosynthesis